jgi:hypothetical protein
VENAIHGCGRRLLERDKSPQFAGKFSNGRRSPLEPGKAVEIKSRCRCREGLDLDAGHVLLDEPISIAAEFFRQTLLERAALSVSAGPGDDTGASDA